MKVALVHDWLTGMRGGERCLQAFLHLYPQADIFTLLHVPGSTSELIDSHVKETSFLQKIPGARKIYRLCLPLYPSAVRQFDFSGYDLVISLSHAAAKNIRVPLGVPHICYCFTPMRYVWDQAQFYFGALTPLLWPVIKAIRAWDRRGSDGVDDFVAISDFVAARIRCFYRRTAEVIYPPVDTSWIDPVESGRPGEAFLYAGALVPYKRVDRVVEAFNLMGERLWIVGRGPEEKRLRKMAGPNIEFFGHVPDRELSSFYRRSRALVFPGTEDFGLIPLECMAAGRPVIALHDGALRETLAGLKPWTSNELLPAQASGVFIQNKQGDGEKAQLDSLLTSVYYFIRHEQQFQVDSCVRQARAFSPQRFFEAWETFIAAVDSDSRARENIRKQYA
ncbi:MAG: glycosyltransferase [Deltaproteobacteria bacterium]|nr:glycosyltransferase [Deltaproteobacteria bacterium]